MLRSLRARRRPVGRLLAVLLLAAFLPAATGCFGGFHLTRKVYDFNRDIDDDKWIRWVGFLVLNVMPVYPFAALFDVFFANPWEFWAGENPVVAGAEGSTRVVRGPEGHVLRATRLAPDRTRLEVTTPSGETHALILVREESSVLARSPETGEPLARVTQVDGRPALVPVR